MLLVNNSPLYYDSGPKGIFRVDYERYFEEYEARVAPGGDLHGKYKSVAGTSDGTQEGDLSELVVGAILWDLDDASSANEPWDRTADRPTIAASVFRYLPNRTNRGVLGADLVDFLDGFRCKGFADDLALMEVLDNYGFNYDFKKVAACP